MLRPRTCGGRRCKHDPDADVAGDRPRRTPPARPRRGVTGDRQEVPAGRTRPAGAPFATEPPPPSAGAVASSALRLTAERAHVDDEAVLHVALQHALVGLVDAAAWGSVSMSDTMPCAAQKSSISCVSAMPPISDPARRRRLKMRLNAPGGACGVGAPPPGPCVRHASSSVRNMSMLCDAATVLRMKSRLLRCGFISASGFLVTTTSAAPRRLASSALFGEVGEEHHVRAHRRRQLHAHVAEAAEAHDAHLAAGAHLPLAQRRVGGDARAEQRRHGRQLGLGVSDAQDELVLHHDVVRVAPEGVGPLRPAPCCRRSR